MDDWSARKTALAIGNAYRVQEQARSIPASHGFSVGEVVRLQRVDYSRYDSAHFYAFTTGEGVQKAFLLHDDEPLSKLGRIFA